MAGVAALAAEPAAAPTYHILHSFGASSTDGQLPHSAMITDAKGNLFGTTLYGGSNFVAFGGAGTVFELSPPAATGGTWKETVLYSFGATNGDATVPWAGLIMDAKGNFYGTTFNGGIYHTCINGSYCGAAFELSPPTKIGGAWTETILHSFGASNTDGRQPQTSLIRDTHGNLYGTTPTGGANCVPSGGCGTAFKLSPPVKTGGTWTETVLHSFGASAADGQSPLASLIMDAKGNLYGTTQSGGAHNNVANGGGGTIFELSPPATADGTWNEKILYSFGANITDARFPSGNLIFDAKGNLYGTTGSGGSHCAAYDPCGTAFELSPPEKPGGAWKETLLYSFGSTRADGTSPPAGLIFDAKGNLYGTANGGALGCTGGCGVVFELSPAKKPGEVWSETLLHSFEASKTDGNSPAGGLVIDAKGNLYGTTRQGGANSPCLSEACGTVFELSP